MNGLKYHTVNDLSVRWKKFKLINTIAHNGYSFVLLAFFFHANRTKVVLVAVASTNDNTKREPFFN